MFYCSHCGRELKIEAKIRREEVCPACGEYLHCCLNCKFFTSSFSRACSEPQAEEIRDREKANFCGFFVFGQGKPASSPRDAAAGARAQFESLFQKDPKKQ